MFVVTLEVYEQHSERAKAIKEMVKCSNIV